MATTTNFTTAATIDAPGAAMHFSFTLGRNMRGDLEAETLHRLDNMARKGLFIRTHKTAGGVVTSCTAQTENGDFWSWDVFGDFSERTTHKGARATEKTITTLHTQALQQVPAMLERIAAHYAKKAAAH